MNIAAWLQSLRLERYERLFRDNEIDWEVLPKLTSDDLKEIGVTAIGHRRKLLYAIAALGAEIPTQVMAATTPMPAANTLRMQPKAQPGPTSDVLAPIGRAAAMAFPVAAVSGGEWP